MDEGLTDMAPATWFMGRVLSPVGEETTPFGKGEVADIRGGLVDPDEKRGLGDKDGLSWPGDELLIPCPVCDNDEMDIGVNIAP